MKIANQQTEPEGTQAQKQQTVLIVDDETFVCQIISRFLSQEGFLCMVAHSVDEALGKLNDKTVDLLISDINMPGKTGLELLKCAREAYSDMAVIMVTAVDDRDTAIYALHLGASGYIIKPFNEKEMIINVTNALERRDLLLERREQERILVKKVEERTLELRQREELIALKLVEAAKYRDEETGAHIRRLGLYSAILADDLGWDARRVNNIRIAATMHDMGKIGIPDEVLLKPGKLTEKEFEVMKSHAVIGHELLKGSDIPLLEMAADIALYHHEKWDGSGYPHGLAGQDIPEAARIVAIADVYDALLTDRVYRAAMSEEKALQIMKDGSGTHFDPAIFQVFLEALPDFRNILQKYADNKTSNHGRYEQ